MGLPEMGYWSRRIIKAHRSIYSSYLGIFRLRRAEPLTDNGTYHSAYIMITYTPLVENGA